MVDISTKMVDNFTKGSRLNWQDIVARKQAIRSAAIEPYLPPTLTYFAPAPGVNYILSGPLSNEDEICNVDDVSVLQSMIAIGRLSAVQVIKAYITR